MAKLKAPVIAAVVVAAAGAAAAAMYVRGQGAGQVVLKEECFGIAKAGENDCAAPNKSHTCGGLAKVDYSGQEWANVPAGTCVKMGGKLQAFDGIGTPPAKL